MEEEMSDYFVHPKLPWYLDLPVGSKYKELSKITMTPSAPKWNPFL